jgi:hypothetical protein
MQFQGKGRSSYPESFSILSAAAYVGKQILNHITTCPGRAQLKVFKAWLTKYVLPELESTSVTQPGGNTIGSCCGLCSREIFFGWSEGELDPEFFGWSEGELDLEFFDWSEGELDLDFLGCIDEELDLPSNPWVPELSFVDGVTFDPGLARLALTKERFVVWLETSPLYDLAEKFLESQYSRTIAKWGHIPRPTLWRRISTNGEHDGRALWTQNLLNNLSDCLAMQICAIYREKCITYRQRSLRNSLARRSRRMHISYNKFATDRIWMEWHSNASLDASCTFWSWRWSTRKI